MPDMKEDVPPFGTVSPFYSLEFPVLVAVLLLLLLLLLLGARQELTNGVTAALFTVHSRFEFIHSKWK